MVKFKTMLITFVDSNCIINKEFSPTRQTISDEYYINVLKRLMARICQIRTEYRVENT